MELLMPIWKSHFFWVPYRRLSTSRGLIKLVEVGPRDGLQNEKVTVPTHVKVELVNKLSRAGMTHIEVSSFVRPSWVPQLADASEVFGSIIRNSGTKYIALVPNRTGMEKALKANPDEVAVFTAASEKFSMTNTNCTIDESMKNIEQVLQLAKEHAIPVRGYVSCVIRCPYEGTVAPDAVARVAEMLWSRGCYEISLGDTTGAGTPESMAALLSVVLDRPGACPREAVAVHCHDTGGNALKNIRVALDDYKINIIDSSIAGLGGCPYAGPNAPGNVATEAVVAQLVNLGYSLSPQIRTENLISISARTGDVPTVGERTSANELPTNKSTVTRSTTN
ncbi:hypothetical protein CRM22_006688 [Opisthorchis felineus]|uniref:hydroxymethylglutaryl-CoA lyase n=1 Tax=Opisthorchis felineus TaxID=147828 RepID=A0A4S2LS19_OPIFE|nr:hypothetical protein CRM22_006688 [Opisthorchis felineus]